MKSQSERISLSISLFQFQLVCALESISVSIRSNHELSICQSRAVAIAANEDYKLIVHDK